MRNVFFSGLYMYKLVLSEPTNSQNVKTKRALQRLCCPLEPSHWWEAAETLRFDSWRHKVESHSMNPPPLSPTPPPPRLLLLLLLPSRVLSMWPEKKKKKKLHVNACNHQASVKARRTRRSYVLTTKSIFCVLAESEIYIQYIYMHYAGFSQKYSQPE